MNGTIFDIKEFSIHDGPGGRITVFLKGCPLRCIWCHNPEGLKKEPQLMHKKILCTDCGMCKAPCEHEECKRFDRCIHACSNGCISVSGTEISAEELAERLNKSADMLKSLGGGITISGGEPMMQADFVCELTDKLDNIHKAIQTSGYTDEETYKRVIDKFDYIMQDIKLIDKEKHKIYTKADNEVILKNIRHLKSSGKEFVFRMPIIPGITDTDENLKSASEIVGNHRIELLSYNLLAGAKYEMLGEKFLLKDIKAEKKDYTKYFYNAVLR